MLVQSLASLPIFDDNLVRFFGFEGHSLGNRLREVSIFYDVFDILISHLHGRLRLRLLNFVGIECRRQRP